MSGQKLLFLISFLVFCSFTAPVVAGSEEDYDLSPYFQDAFFGLNSSKFSEIEDTSERLSEDLLQYLSDLQLPPEKDYLKIWNQFRLAQEQFILKKHEFMTLAENWLESYNDTLSGTLVPEFDETHEINNQDFDEFREKEERSPFMKISTLYAFLLSSGLDSSNHLKKMVTEFFQTRFPDEMILGQVTDSLTKFKNPESFQDVVSFLCSLSGLELTETTVIRYKSEFFKKEKSILLEELNTLNHWIHRIETETKYLKKKK